MKEIKTQELDIWLLGAMLVLILFGLAVLFNTRFDDHSGLSIYFKRQAQYALVGLVLLVGAAWISPRMHFAFAYLLFGMSSLILLVVLFMGETGKGAVRWIDVGILSFQPSEPAKIGLVLALARLLSDKKFDPHKVSHLMKAVGITLVLLILVLAQPDLGTSIIFAAVFIFMMIARGIPYSLLLILISPLLAVVTSFHAVAFLVFIVLLLLLTWLTRMRLAVMILLILGNLAISVGTPQLWNHLKPYQRDRLVSFLNPEADPKGSGYQVIQSKVAIGSGGLWGKGLGKGSQTHLKFLPEQHTDFVFSVVGEELGLAGASAVLLLLFLVIYRGFREALQARGRYGMLVCTGLTSMIAVHTFINVGMAIGLMPVTGLPLPFLSYGGSFLWTAMIAVGLILGIQLHRKEYTP